MNIILRRHTDGRQTHEKELLTSLIVRETESKPQWDTTSHLFEWLLSKDKKIWSVGKGCGEKGDPEALMVKMRMCAVTMGFLRLALLVWMNNSTSGYFSKNFPKPVWKDIFFHAFLCRINSQ